jgi:hypothetical protein
VAGEKRLFRAQHLPALVLMLLSFSFLAPIWIFGHKLRHDSLFVVPHFLLGLLSMIFIGKAEQDKNRKTLIIVAFSLFLITALQEAAGSSTVAPTYITHKKNLFLHMPFV